MERLSLALQRSWAHCCSWMKARSPKRSSPRSFLPGSPDPQPRTATENCPWTTEGKGRGIRGGEALGKSRSEERMTNGGAGLQKAEPEGLPGRQIEQNGGQGW